MLSFYKFPLKKVLRLHFISSGSKVSHYTTLRSLSTFPTSIDDDESQNFFISQAKKYTSEQEKVTHLALKFMSESKAKEILKIKMDKDKDVEILKLQVSFWQNEALLKSQLCSVSHR
jgi:hypothetical protein